MDITKIEQNINRYRERFEDKLKEIYPKLYRDGFRFYTNRPVENKDECTARLHEKGLKVEIGEHAFDLTLKELSTYVCIFIKE